MKKKLIILGIGLIAVFLLLNYKGIGANINIKIEDEGLRAKILEEKKSSGEKIKLYDVQYMRQLYYIPPTDDEIYGMIFRGEEIPEFKPLTTLNDFQYFESLVHLKIAIDTNNLKGLENLKQLETLEVISDNSNSLDVSAIKNLPELSAVDFNVQGKIENLETLADMPQLYALGLHDYPYEEAHVLSKITNLRDLTLTNWSGMTDLSCISDLTNLERIEIKNCDSLQSLSGLEALKNVERIYFTKCYRLTDISALKELPNLKEISFYACPYIEDTEFLNELPEDVYVYIDE